MIISLNGADETGKTTHISLLAYKRPSAIVVPPLSTFDTGWNEMDEKGRKRGGRDWWFAADNCDDFLSLMTRSVHARSCYVKSLERGNPAAEILVDRGDQMVGATMCATLRIKSGISFIDARRKVETLLPSPGPMFEESYLPILIKRKGPIGERVSKTLARMSLGDDVEFLSLYTNYQAHLQQEIGHLEELGKFKHIILSEETVVDIQNDIRQAINSRSRKGYEYPYLLSGVKAIFGLAGMSESGKSCVGEILRRKGSMRLKQKYFMDRVSDEIGSSSYDHPAPQQALMLLGELSTFTNAHAFNSIYSIESLRRNDLTREFKKVVGDRFHIIYMDLDRETAALRTAGELGLDIDTVRNMIGRKDQEKASVGCEQIRDIADTVIDNSKSLRSLERKVLALVEKLEI